MMYVFLVTGCELNLGIEDDCGNILGPSDLK
jgi:hypothetical protein